MTLSTPVAKVTTTSPRMNATLLLQVALDRKQAGRRLAELREEQRLTQWALHEQSGLSLRTVQRYENGNVAPRFDNLDALAKVLGAEVYDIFKESPNGQQETPDPLGNSQLDRIEAKLDAALALLGLEAEDDDLAGLTTSQRVAALVEQTARRQAAQQSRREPGEKSASTAKRRAAR